MKTLNLKLTLPSLERDTLLAGGGSDGSQFGQGTLGTRSTVYMYFVNFTHGGTWSNRMYVAHALFSLLATCVVF